MNSVLNSLAPILVGPSLVEDLLKRVSQWVISVTNCQHARLYLIDRHRQELHCRVNDSPGTYELRLPISRGLHGQVVSQQGGRIGRSADAGESLLVVPVFSPTRGPASSQKPEVIALLEVANRGVGHLFVPEDEQRLIEVAEEVARVLAHARLDDSRHAPQRITGIVGNSAAMLDLYAGMESVAASCTPLTLLGAHGVGKTRIATAIHHLGSGAHAALVTLLCHAEHACLEAELFGVHRSPAGQEVPMPGALERAAGGTLIIEHVDLLSLDTQERLVDRVRQLDVRIIATLLHSDSLEGQGEPLERRLAPALFVRRLTVPTLAQRGPDDVGMLTHHFVREWSSRLRRPNLGIDAGALTRLRAQEWRGNVRELERCIQSAVLASSEDTIEAHHLCLPGEQAGATASDSIPSGLLLADAEERYILRTLTENSQNRTRTASSLGIGRNTLVRKIKQYRNK
ncbi:MAG: sigma-54-dependent Fis family transcriptional regulator [Myxococcales bacterium]|nr:sigma-54-dependent Fis family transcriptional regulator [Myxococcales bacterium]